jgi:hypothetical protein
MPELSPAAQAIYNAVLEICSAPADEIAAAALRAAAEHLSYLLPFEDSTCVDVADLLAIAAELEAR